MSAPRVCVRAPACTCVCACVRACRGRACRSAWGCACGRACRAWVCTRVCLRVLPCVGLTARARVSPPGRGVPAPAAPPLCLRWAWPVAPRPRLACAPASGGGGACALPARPALPDSPAGGAEPVSGGGGEGGGWGCRVVGVRGVQGD